MGGGGWAAREISEKVLEKEERLEQESAESEKRESWKKKGVK